MLTSSCLLFPAATDLLRSNINDMLSKVTIGSRMLFTPESVATLEDDVGSGSIPRSHRPLADLDPVLPTRRSSSLIRFISLPLSKKE